MDRTDNPRWEYRWEILLSHGKSDSRETLELRHGAEDKILNDLGEDGWEMFWIIQPRADGNVYAYFKRRKG